MKIEYRSAAVGKKRLKRCQASLKQLKSVKNFILCSRKMILLRPSERSGNKKFAFKLVIYARKCATGRLVHIGLGS